jgi:3-oxoacyl-[acyl-carrier protein] reductase
LITADLSGRRALITGGASGIGLATAELFARSGASVAINDLPSNPALMQQIKRLEAEGLNVIAAPADTSDEVSASAMVNEAIQQLGGLDYLVNNAGTPGTRVPISPADFTSQSAAFWQRLLAVNLLGPFHCTVAAEAALRQSRGAIVNTASTAGIIGNGSSSAYAASKAALISMTREHARGLGPDVRVNAIAPGVVESNWECRFELDQAYLNTLPLKRSGLPADFAETILFLCAGAAYITGQIIVVDGGLTAGPAVQT